MRPSQPLTRGPSSRRLKNVFVRILFALALLFLTVNGPVSARRRSNPAPHPGRIRAALERLKTLGTALYIAAHPDDENTALLAYLVHARKLRVAYLALTRGDGGQNLIGKEKGPIMGLLRTYELLAARAIDGAEQYFTRAIDFGYSKSAEESLRFWGKQRILADMVHIIRLLQPDIIITRFPPRGYAGHGHHTASAILAVEAFQLSGKPDAFPEQIRTGLKPWKPKRLLWNAWRRRHAPPPMDHFFKMNIGTYFPYLGLTTGEIAARSRSMHRSQGFGSGVRRGEWIERFQLLAGEPFTRDILEGIDLTWNRIQPGSDIPSRIDAILKAYEPHAPEKVVPMLIELLDRVRKLPDTPLTRKKQEEIKQLIRWCAGIWFEAVTERPYAVAGESLNVTVGIENRGHRPIHLRSITMQPGSIVIRPARSEIPPGTWWTHTLTLPVSSDQPVSQPYWLVQPPDGKTYHILRDDDIERPVDSPPFQVELTFDFNGHILPYSIPLTYRWVDPVLGERRRELVVSPAVVVHLPESVLVFPDHQPKTFEFQIEAVSSKRTGRMHASLSDPTWHLNPVTFDVQIPDATSAITRRIRITPPLHPSSADLTFYGPQPHTVARRRIVIDYPHIPVIAVFPVARVRLVRVNLRRCGHHVGYIMGSGDDIPVYLRQLGYSVTLLADEDLENGDLSQYDAIIAGIRAYNTRPVLTRVYQRLMTYIRNGGTYVVQYNTTRRLPSGNIGPFPFKISRTRITDETAPLHFASPSHPILNKPNRITTADFSGWVQERGLYFAGQWDPRYETPLAGHDPGEKDTRGALLYTRYGKGIFIYTGLAFFRQLPAGVPGAYRLFVNLIDANRPDQECRINSPPP